MKKSRYDPISKLGIGPLSSEIIEAAFRYSSDAQTPLMLICSKNQIDWNGGYVNNWNTKQYIQFIRQMRKQYPNAKIYICRDHCGPGFTGDFDLKDVYRTIAIDLENGFDLIHIDFSKFQGNHEEILRQSKKVIKHILGLAPKILLEVGTEENTGKDFENLDRIESDMVFFTNFCHPHFFVCQTGTVIKEINQYGSFNLSYVAKLKVLADKYGIFLKEHNSDHITASEISLRKGLIGAVNVAPQYGVMQTQLSLQKCATYGIDFTEFLEAAYRSGKWKKWLSKNDQKNKYLCSIIAGHYNFATDAYRKIYKQIQYHEDFKELIISEMMRNFKIYIDSLS